MAMFGGLNKQVFIEEKDKNRLKSMLKDGSIEFLTCNAKF